MPLKSFKTRKELLIPIQDVYLNKLQRIWVYNSNIQRNTDLENWVQMGVTCPKCKFSFVERLIGEGYDQHLTTINHQKLIKEMYICACPFCENHWSLDATRPYDAKTLALNVDDDVNEGIQEVDDEIKESKRTNK